MNNINYKSTYKATLALLIMAEITTSSQSVLAQLTPDATLGSESSTISNNGLKDTVTGGATRGINLFHSFQEFNVDAGRSVYFANPINIENILTRVTGNNISNILGTLGVEGNANLFLINPNGIYFGKDAVLDIKGSFTATTADSIKLGENGLFSAKDPQNSNLLNVQPGVLFTNALRNYQAEIKNEGKLQVGKDLTLNADNLTLNGQIQAGNNLNLQARNTVKIRDSVSEPLIASAGNNLLIQGNENIDIFALNNSNSGLFSGGNMVLRSGNTIGGDAHYYTGGNFQIEQLDGSLGNLYSPYDPIVRANGNLSFNSYSGASLHIFSGGSVNIPNGITITGKDTTTNSISQNVTLSDGNTIVNINGNTTSTLDIRAGTTAVGTQGIRGNTNGFSTWPTTTYTPTSADIKIGDITNKGGTVFLTNQYQPNTLLSGGAITVNNISTNQSYGNGGSVYIDARGDITANYIASDTSSGSNTKGGDIKLLSQGNVLINGGSSAGRTTGLLSGADDTINGNAGNISIKANGNISINPTNKYLEYGAINASIIRRYSDNVGNSGTIQLTSNNGNITVNKGIFTNTTAENGNIAGNSGDIMLNATQGNVNVTANNAGTIVTRTRSLGTTGNAGKIEINAKTINLVGVTATGDLNITTQSNRTGIGGDIIFNSQNPLDLTQLTIGTDGLNGAGGSVKINAPNIIINNTSITTKTAGKGQAGNVELRANNGSISLNNSSIIKASADTGATGNGGEIKIFTQDFTLTGGSLIDASTAGIGNAGNVNLNITGNVNISGTNSKLSTSTSSTGIGGNIDILTNSFRVADNALLDAKTSGTGTGGNIKITSNTVDVVNGGKLQGTTSAQGNAGKIDVIASDIITLDGANSSLTTSSENGSQGNAGDITLQGKLLTLTNGAQILSNTAGTGKAGNIAVTTTAGISISGANSGIFASTQDTVINVSNGVAFTESGDAGQLINTAQDFTTIPGTFVTSITGSLNNSSDADLYKIYLSGNKQFSATTVGNTTIDTRLFLFDASGKGVYANEDVSSYIYQSTLPADNALTPVTPGIYYLGIASFPNTPYSNGGEIFDLNNYTDVSGNINTGGNLPLSSWSSGSDSGNYTINLKGTAALIPKTQTLKGGDGGNITLKAASVSVNNSGQIVAKTAGGGNAGTVNINADTVNFNNGNVVTSVESGATGQGGVLNITGKSLTVSNNSVINSSTASSGNAGNVNLNITDNINISGTNSKLSTSTSSTGIGGNIDILTKNFRVADNAILDTKTSGTGTGGKIKVTTNTFDVVNGGKLQGSTSAQGNADTITVIASDKITIDGANSSLTTSAENGSIGQAGNISLKGRSLTLSNGAVVTSNTAGKGNAGNIELNTTDNITIYGANTKLSTSSNSSGKGGNITASTNLFNISDNAVLDAQTSNIGDGGDITINSNIFTANNAKLEGTTTNTGKAGNINLNTPESVSLNQSILTVQGTNAGASGSITVKTKKLSLDNTSEISASTNLGVGGDINLQNLETLTLNNSEISASTVDGKAGNINITANKLVEINGEKGISVEATGTGSAGNITINTPELNIGNNAIISASNVDGIGGNINITANKFTANNRGQVLTTTSGKAKAGNIIMKVKDNITLDGTNTGLFANTQIGSKGDSGSIDIDPEIFMITNGAGIGVNSQGKGKGGNINITAGTLTLDNKSFITAETINNEGGEITLNINDLLWLRNNSQITATAGTAGAGGNGGNININVPFIIGFASENSDITANAFEGNGGKINITTNTIFGLKFRPQLTPLSDITASSQFGLSGQVTINRLDVDPSKGILSLPANFVDNSNKLAQGCNSNSGKIARQQSRFSIMGKGGLPSHPDDVFSGTSPIVDLVDIQTTKISQNDNKPVVINHQNNQNNQKVNLKNREIQQAQGWVFTNDGRVILTAESSQVIPQNTSLNNPGCEVFSQ